MTESKIKKDMSNVYSTEEQVIGTWIDGKPIYRKTLLCQCNQVPNSYTPHGITNLGYVISAQGFSYIPNGVVCRYMIAASWASVEWNRSILINDTDIVIESGESIAGQAQYIYITIEYTKTTD